MQLYHKEIKNMNDVANNMEFTLNQMEEIKNKTISNMKQLQTQNVNSPS